MFLPAILLPKLIVARNDGKNMNSARRSFRLPDDESLSRMPTRRYNRRCDVLIQLRVIELLMFGLVVAQVSLMLVMRIAEFTGEDDVVAPGGNIRRPRGIAVLPGPGRGSHRLH